jgi:heme-degrading monooxygenase HmoA
MYGPDGAWVNLFRSGDGYAGTELLFDRERPHRYLTIDRWMSRDKFEGFQSMREVEYKTLDEQCDGLTESESLLGTWETL